MATQRQIDEAAVKLVDAIRDAGGTEALSLEKLAKRDAAYERLRSAGAEDERARVNKVEPARTAAALITEHPEWYDELHGVSKTAVPRPLSKTDMELLLTNPAIYDDMVQKGLLP
jgi:hypothetical protein